MDQPGEKRIRCKVEESKDVISLDKRSVQNTRDGYDRVVGRNELIDSAVPKDFIIKHEDQLDEFLSLKDNCPAKLANLEIYLGSARMVHRYLNKMVLQNISRQGSADLVSLRTVYDHLGSKDLPFNKGLGMHVDSAEALPVWSCNLTGAQVWSYTGYSKSQEEKLIREGVHPVTYFLGKRYSTTTSLDGRRKPGYAP